MEGNGPKRRCKNQRLSCTSRNLKKETLNLKPKYICTGTNADPCKCCVCYLILCLFICFLIFEGFFFLIILHTSGPLLVLLPLWCGSLSPEGKNLIKTSYLVMSGPKYLTLCIMSACSSLYSFPSAAWRKTL